MASVERRGSKAHEDSIGQAGRIRSLFRRSRTLARVVYRDPENVPERLALKTIEWLAEPSLAWARDERERAGSSPASAAENLRLRSAAVARVDGAIAGTPFLIALVPGYLGYLWQEASMVLRTAALYGRDPRDLRTGAELLALRGIHVTVEQAQVAIEHVAGTPLPDKPARRRSLRTWVHSIRMLLVFGGFLSNPKSGEQSRPRSRPLAMVAASVGVAIWIGTWVFPVTLMVMLAWSCERDTRELGRRAQSFYSGEALTAEAAIRFARLRTDRGHGVRQLLRSVALVGSVALPIAFVAYADHIRNTTGVNWIGALGALVALAVVIATTVVARSR